jgi:hypothetical protein
MLVEQKRTTVMAIGNNPGKRRCIFSSLGVKECVTVRFFR